MTDDIPPHYRVIRTVMDDLVLYTPQKKTRFLWWDWWESLVVVTTWAGDSRTASSLEQAKAVIRRDIDTPNGETVVYVCLPADLVSASITDYFASLLREIPGETVVLNKMSGPRTAAEFLSAIEQDTPEGREFISEALRVARDLIIRRAAKAA